jgi:hypothetical protein
MGEFTEHDNLATLFEAVQDGDLNVDGALALVEAGPDAVKEFANDWRSSTEE